MRNPKACVSDPNSFVTCPGSRKHIEYSVTLKEDGTLKFIESGYTDIQEQIDAWFPLTDMHYIVSKLMAGDTSVIRRNTNPPMFGDFSRIPKTPIEILNLVNGCKKVFEDLPLDVRTSYDNDFNKWFAQLGEKAQDDVAEVKETETKSTE